MDFSSRRLQNILGNSVSIRNVNMMKAVQENKRFSRVVEDALREYLRLPKETRGIEESTTVKKQMNI